MLLITSIPHTKWNVTALSEANTSGNEGGVAFLKDENASTFYHSNWSVGYSDGTSGKNKGQDGVQAFMVEMPEVLSFDKITYTGRSDNGNNWATKVRIYVYETLPAGLTTDLSSLTYTQKENLLGKSNSTLGTPAFDNNNSPWASDRTLKTAEFSTKQTGKYILFVVDETTYTNGYFTCSDFHVWQKIEGVVENRPYFLKVKNKDIYIDTQTAHSDNYANTIALSSTNKVKTYFTLNDGYWSIRAGEATSNNCLAVAKWCVNPGQSSSSRWTLHEVDGYWCLAQDSYYGDSNALRCYVGADDISAGKKIYTDRTKSSAVYFEFIPAEISQEESNMLLLDVENALSKKGVGYPVVEERSNLEAAVEKFNESELTFESYSELLTAYTEYINTSNVNMPEDGKAYVFTAMHKTKESKYLYYDAENDELMYASRGTSSVEELPMEAKFICRKLSGEGINSTYAFVNNAGRYLVWRGKDQGYNSTKGFTPENEGYNSDYCVVSFGKMLNTGANTSNLDDSAFFGWMAFGAKRPNYNSVPFLYSNGTDEFNQDTGWTLRYDDNHSSAFLVEEVSYPNNVKLTPIDAERDVLINDLEGAIGTFSAPYATVIPEGVTAYVADGVAQDADGITYVPVKEYGSKVVAEAVPVILAASKGEYSIGVGGKFDAYEGENGLTGVLKSVSVSGSNIFTIDGKEMVKRVANSGYLTANTAYYTAETAESTLPLRADAETSIDEVEAEKSVKYYALKGNVVEKPQRGIYVTSEGKKIIVL